MSRGRQCLMTENAMGAGRILLDLGYIYNEETRKRADALRAAGVGRINFSIEGFSRLIVNIPRTKLAALCDQFPIIEGGHYWQTTHRWEPKQEVQPSSGNEPG